MSLENSPSYWTCDGCNQQLNHGEYRYNCTVCDDYDYCEKCQAKSGYAHPHRMDRELCYGAVEKEGFRLNSMENGLRTAFRLYHDRYCFGTRDRDPKNPSNYLNSYSWITYQTVSDRKDNFGHGLRGLIDERGYLGICAANRPEWMITDFACMFQNIISVPIYCLFTDSEITFVINNTDISVIVCDENMLKRFIVLGKSCPSLRHVICMDPIPQNLIDNNRNNHFSLHFMGNVEEQGKIKKYSHRPTEPDECLTIIYTSGSSGFPKGAIISETAYRATFPGFYLSNIIERIKFTYRPLAWAADRDATIGTVFCGGRIGFSTQDVNRLMEELSLVRPTQFSAPPSIWNKIYSEFKAALALLNDSQSEKVRAEEERRLLKEFSKLMPNRCKMLTVGSAKISPIVFEFMRRCFRHCEINESYGITECGAVAYNSQLDGDVQYRLESVPEMGYTVDDKPYPRGEILTKTNQMFSGYVNNVDETNAALTEDGFFRTGDIVEVRGDIKRHPDIHIIDRKKNFFKLSQGQFVAPEVLQGLYIRSPFIEQIYIHGDILANCVSAVIVPNRDYTKKFLKEHKIEKFDYRNPDRRFHRAILKDIRSIAKEKSLRPHEIPSHLVIDFEPFTAENGLLTSSLKPCRHKLAAYYADQLKPRKDVQQELKSILEKVTGQSIGDDDDDDDEDRTFISAGGDSLTAVRLSRMIEQDLGVPIPATMLFETNMNIKRLTNLIENPSQISLLKQSMAEELKTDSRMELNIKIGTCKRSATSPSIIFVTGTTGFVGAFLLAELLTVYPSHCRFICLVRSKSSRNVLQAIRDNLIFYELWNDDYQQRIIPLEGDLAEPCFGLSHDQYQSLAEQIDLIYHCGAIVNFVLSYHQLYNTNVLGTREIIRLAAYGSNCVPVQYISTISVLSSNFDGEISIEKISPDRLRSGYGQSKWVAEKLISRAMRSGLPVVIYRLGSIGPSTKTGACNKQDIHTLLLAAMMKLGCYPRKALDSRFDGLPADYTAKSIVYLSRQQSAVYGNIYHVLNSTEKISFEQIIRMGEKNGIQLNEVSAEEWRKNLRKITDIDGPFESVGEYLLDSGFNEESSISNDHFIRATSHLSYYPHLDDEYVSKWMKFVFCNILSR